MATEKNRKKTRSGIHPTFRIGLDLPAQQGFRKILPFRRSWKFILVLAAIDIVFLWPAWHVLQSATAGWTGFDDLFSLVTSIFMTAWLLGWSIAPLLMTLALVIMLFGREVISASPGRFELFVGLPFLGIKARYDPRAMRNLRLETAPQQSGRSWRGSYLVFEYGANSVEFGSDLDLDTASEIRMEITAATGVSIRQGRATAGELSGEWDAAEPLVADEALMERTSVSPQPGETVTWSSPSTLLLILANLVPLGGAAFMGWSLGEVMVLYWCESAIIGFYNLCKLVLIGRWAALLSAPFFLAHYGAFMTVHFLFVYVLFIEGPRGFSSQGGDLAEVAGMFADLRLALLVLFISHGYSFMANFVGRQEYRSRDSRDQMKEPYQRIIFMHLVLIFGGGLAMVLGQVTPVLAAVIMIKIVVDVRSHIREHSTHVRNKNHSA